MKEVIVNDLMQSNYKYFLTQPDFLFLKNVKQEAIDNVKRLRNHPSIALWCGNNENSKMNYVLDQLYLEMKSP